MSDWIKNLKQKPESEKIKLFWTVLIISIVALAALWVVSSKYSAKPEKADTSLFDTLGQGIHNFKESFKNR